MILKDFIYILSDAIQYHEGWLTGTRSVRNNNPGNLRYVGQQDASPDGSNFCIFKTFEEGKQALINDLTIKLEAHPEWTLSDLIGVYAPPIENDTQQYIQSVTDFFSWRGWKIDPHYPIANQLPGKPAMLICLNQMGDVGMWHYAQQQISEFCTYQKDVVVTTRYTNVPLSCVPLGIVADSVPLSGVSLDVAQNTLATVNEGQEFNMFLYNSEPMNIQGEQLGGLTEERKAVSDAHTTTVYAEISLNRGWSGGINSRSMFHEFIHMLFERCGDFDTLHNYLLSHGGYLANTLTDLQAVYAPLVARYQELLSGVTIATEAVQLAENNPSSLSTILPILQKVALYLKQLLRL